MARYTLAHASDNGTGLRWLRFVEPPAKHARAGQFVALQPEGLQQSYFAIASCPGAPLELLIKVEGDVALALAELVPGEQVDGTDAMGGGFGHAETRPRPLVCLVNGSALSAVRPVIADELASGLSRPVTLLYGVLSPEHRPWVDELSAWAEAGVDVIEVLDHPAPDWTGPTGFVQDHAVARGLVRDDVAVLLCGVPPMQRAATALYTAAGLDPALLLTNY